MLNLRWFALVPRAKRWTVTMLACVTIKELLFILFNTWPSLNNFPFFVARHLAGNTRNIRNFFVRIKLRPDTLHDHIFRPANIIMFFKMSFAQNRSHLRPVHGKNIVGRDCVQTATANLQSISRVKFHPDFHDIG